MANQHQPDPRQALFLTYYLDPKSETFSNAKQSAIKVGYSEEYADNIMALLPDWLSDKLGDDKRLRKAEKFMDELLDMPAVDPEGKVDNALISNKLKVASIYAKGLGKAKYSERVEQTGANGQPLIVAFDKAFEPK